MRTASRLDFIAKCLALGALGALGLSAALLDRWSSDLPTVVPPAMDVTAPAVRIAMMLPQSTAAVAIPARAPVKHRSRRLSEITAGVFAQDTVVAEVVPAPAADSIASTPDQHQLPVAVATAPIPGSLVGLSALPPILETWQPMAASAVAAAAERSDDGFVPGVLKKTGASVSNSLGKASTTLLGAARLVSDVVKRAF